MCICVDVLGMMMMMMKNLNQLVQVAFLFLQGHPHQVQGTIGLIFLVETVERTNLKKKQKQQKRAFDRLKNLDAEIFQGCH